VLVTHGGLSAGYALMLQNGKPAFHYSWLNREHYEIAAKDAVPAGPHTIGFDFQYDGGGIGKGGTGTISVDGRPVAKGRIDRTIPVRFSFDETFDVGADTGTPVSESYDVPFKYNGRIEKVVIDLDPGKLSAAEERKLQGMAQKARLAVQ
jgi:hypothetical protein